MQLFNKGQFNWSTWDHLKGSIEIKHSVQKPAVKSWHDQNLSYLTSWIILLGWERVKMSLIWLGSQKIPLLLEYFKSLSVDPLGHFRAAVNWREINSARNFLNSLLTFKAWWALGGKRPGFFVLMYDLLTEVFWQKDNCTRSWVILDAIASVRSARESWRLLMQTITGMGINKKNHSKTSMGGAIYEIWWWHTCA